MISLFALLGGDDQVDRRSQVENDQLKIFIPESLYIFFQFHSNQKHHSNHLINWEYTICWFGRKSIDPVKPVKLFWRAGIRFVKLAQFDYQVKHKFIITHVLCSASCLHSFFGGKWHANFWLLFFRETSPQTEITWYRLICRTFKDGKWSTFFCCSTTVNFDTDWFDPVSWPIWTSSSVWLISSVTRCMMGLFDICEMKFGCLRKESFPRRGAYVCQRKGRLLCIKSCWEHALLQGVVTYSRHVQCFNPFVVQPHSQMQQFFLAKEQSERLDL